MDVYRFELHFMAPPGEQVIDRLYEAGWDDATVSLDPDVGGIGVAAFDREAGSAVEAIASAIRQGRAAGVEITGVTEDLVTLSEIAERLTPAEVGEFRGLSSPVVVRLMDAGEIPSEHLPGSGHRMVRLADVLAFQARRERRRAGRRRIADAVESADLPY